METRNQPQDGVLSRAPDPPREDILGVQVSAVNMRQTLAIIDGWIARREPHYVCVTPAHSVMECYRDPDLRRIFNASGLTTPDGMSIVWALRLLGHKHVARVYGPDLMHALCRHSAARGYRHYFYGGVPGVAQALADRLRHRYPGLQVAGFCSPPFRDLAADEEQAIADRIRQARPDVLWVGLGSPKQEIWMSRQAGRLAVPALIGVGAAFDFLSGRKPQAPRWIQRGGLEWLYRFAREPRRLWPRYSRYPLFALLLAAQILRRRFSRSR